MNKATQTVILHSPLGPKTFRDTLVRSIDNEIIPQSATPWFFSPLVNRGSHQVLGAVQENSFRLVKRKLWSSVLTPNFYGQWLPDRNGTRIEGYFDVAPIVRVSLPLSFGLILALAAIGVVLNVIDLTAGTHFTHDPEVGLVISLCLVPFVVIGYFAVKRLGSRSDESLMEFLERTVAAERVR